MSRSSSISTSCAERPCTQRHREIAMRPRAQACRDAPGTCLSFRLTPSYPAEPGLPNYVNQDRICPKKPWMLSCVSLMAPYIGFSAYTSASAMDEAGIARVQVVHVRMTLTARLVEIGLVHRGARSSDGRIRWYCDIPARGSIRGSRW